MAYLTEFRAQIATRNMAKFLELWQEYCAGDAADGQEIIAILQAMKQSDIAKQFGPIILEIMPLIEQIQSAKEKLTCYQLVFDLETQNSPELFELALTLLKQHFPNAAQFSEKLRLIGLRLGESFQGCISNFILLEHLQKGNFVLHTAGWGVGEISDVSFIREQATIEFENLNAKKEISFKNSFKTLIPVEKSHFLARRFANPDALEAEAREKPEKVIREFLQDLGPKTAAEIRDEFIDLVIPEKDFAKWWQSARGRLKKDAQISVPENAKEPFQIQTSTVSLDDRLEKALHGKTGFQELLQAAHSFLRDFPETAKNEALRTRLIEKLQAVKAKAHLHDAEELQLLLFFENPLGVEAKPEELKKLIQRVEHVETLLQKIELLALKKRILLAISQHRKDATEIFLDLLFTIEPNQLRDFLLKELIEKGEVDALKKKTKELITHPRKHPEAVFWYFQKTMSGDFSELHDKSAKYALFEALLTALSFIDMKNDARSKDMAKKIYAYLTGQRFQLIRDILKGSPETFAKEFLLLSSKCQSFSDHDKKILQSLVEVAHPQLAETKEKLSDFSIIWTTEEALQRVQERIKSIGTVEMCDVAKEIEVARGHGDLRENAEYKSALERRNRLQSELKLLSQQFNQARIISKADIAQDEVGVGSRVSLLGPKGEKLSYTILGPWDADADKNILSFQSKFAQAMEGKKPGEKFQFKGEEFKILQIANFLEI